MKNSSGLKTMNNSIANLVSHFNALGGMSVAFTGENELMEVVYTLLVDEYEAAGCRDDMTTITYIDQTANGFFF